MKLNITGIRRLMLRFNYTRALRVEWPFSSQPHKHKIVKSGLRRPGDVTSKRSSYNQRQSKEMAMMKQIRQTKAKNTMKRLKPAKNANKAKEKKMPEGCRVCATYPNYPACREGCLD